MDSAFLPILPIAAVAVVLAALPVLTRTLRLRGFALGVTAVGVGLAATGALALAARLFPPLVAEHEIPDRPVEQPRHGYVSSDACRACHPRQYASWHRSYHRTMTQVASPETLAGDFDDVRLEFHGRSYHLERRGDEFWVEMDDPAWDDRRGPPPRIERRIVMTTGSHHNQDYWYATPDPGRDLRLLPLDFRLAERRWIPFNASFLMPPDAQFVYSDSNWTKICVKCHATHGEVSVDPIDERIDARVAEFGIACEACHGPAGEHVEANRDPRRRYAMHLGDEPDPTITNPRELDAPASAAVCGQCHGQWTERRPGADLTHSPTRYQPGGDLERDRIYQQFAAAHPAYEAIDPQKHRVMKHFVEERHDYLMRSFWPDGMVRVSGREYTGLIESPCFAGGEISCLSCHSMHPEPDDPRPLDVWANDQLAPGMDGNAACVGCHPAFEQEDALVAHTRHAPGSSGSSCYNCHMPFTGYGIMKAHRSHQVDSPSVAASLETGRPNACNACHLDRTLAWTAERLEERYGIAAPELARDEREIAASVLWTLRGDAGQRALMAWHMGWDAAREASGSAWMPPYLGELMTDPYDAVRFIAGRSLGRHDAYRDLDYDFVAGPEHLAGARADVLRRWRGRDAPSPAPAVLQPDGRLDRDAWQRLLAERDQRPVQLDE